MSPEAERVLTYMRNGVCVYTSRSGEKYFIKGSGMSPSGSGGGGRLAQGKESGKTEQVPKKVITELILEGYVHLDMNLNEVVLGRSGILDIQPNTHRI